MTTILNAISSGEARQRLEEETGTTINRQVYRKIFKVMVEATHATPATKRGGEGIVLASEMPNWATYMRIRNERIGSGEWSRSRPYSIEDFREVNNENSAA